MADFSILDYVCGDHRRMLRPGKCVCRKAGPPARFVAYSARGLDLLGNPLKMWNEEFGGGFFGHG